MCEKMQFRDFSGIGAQEFLFWKTHKRRLQCPDTFWITPKIPRVDFFHTFQAGCFLILLRHRYHLLAAHFAIRSSQKPKLFARQAVALLGAPLARPRSNEIATPPR
jgi:hypothetical protein